MHESDASPPTDVRVGPPGGTADGRRDGRDRVVGLLGVLFFGTWMVIFAVAAVLMVAIIVAGAHDLANTLFLAAVCAAISVFNGWRLRRPLRRLRGIRSPRAL